MGHFSRDRGGRDRLDLGPNTGHGAAGRPPLAVPLPVPMRLHETMVKPQEVEAVGTVPEVHDPGLVRMQTQLERLGGSLEPSMGALRVGLCPTQDHGIVRVADDAPEMDGLLRPEGIEGVAVDIAQERRYRAALRNPG